MVNRFTILFPKLIKSKKMKLRISYILVILFVIMCPLLTIAQGPPGPPGGGVVDTPIDGGLSLLLAAGVGYGIKKYREQKRKGSDNI